MAGFDRYSCILQLFSEDISSWRVTEIADELGTPASTVYRIVRELVGAGFLESAKGSYLRLGPAFVEHNRTINKTDPLIRSGATFLDAFVNELPISGLAVLARLYGSKVMCVADARSASFKYAASYQRGRPMPIARGATSKAILAQIKGKRLGQLLESTEFGTDVERLKFLSDLDEIQSGNISVTRGEVDEGLVGCAVPVSNKSLGIVASLSCVFEQQDFSTNHRPKVFSDLWTFAKLIQNHMQMAFDEIANEHGEVVLI